MAIDDSRGAHSGASTEPEGAIEVRFGAEGSISPADRALCTPSQHPPSRQLASFGRRGPGAILFWNKLTVSSSTPLVNNPGSPTLVGLSSSRADSATMLQSLSPDVPSCSPELLALARIRFALSNINMLSDHVATLRVYPRRRVPRPTLTADDDKVQHSAPKGSNVFGRWRLVPRE
jgi:hypothetical protein